MAADLNDLITPLTVDEIKTSIYETIAATGTDHTTWLPGAIMRTFITAVAIVLAAFSRLQSKIAAGGYLEYSEGNWLTLLAYFVFGVERIAATFAAGSVTLDNTGGGSYSEAAYAVTFRDPATGKTFQNTAAFTLDPLETGVTVPVQAVDAGASSTAVVGAISAIVSPAMVGVNVTNAAALIGSDQELDAQLRVRCRERLGALSPMGPWDAYSYAAKTATLSTGGPAGVTRVHITKDGYGNVFAYLASDAGGVTGTIGDLSTPLGAADENMQQKAVAQCVTLNSAGATNEVIYVVYSIAVYDSISLSDAQLQTLINTALVAYFKTLPIGGDRKPGEANGLVRDHILKAVIRSVRPQEIFDVQIQTPGGDVSLSDDEVPVLGGVTCSGVTRVNLESLQ